MSARLKKNLIRDNEPSIYCLHGYYLFAWLLFESSTYFIELSKTIGYYSRVASDRAKKVGGRNEQGWEAHTVHVYDCIWEN